ncbi:MAG: OmpA family protein [Bacteroidota bacterium]
MFRAIFFLISVLFTWFASYSQNLVPNPGFEEYTKLPNNWIVKPEKFEESLIHWTTPTETTPDIISLLVEEGFWANPKNKKQSGGSQLPRTGNNMAGFRTFGEGEKGAVACWHEYLQAKLTGPMVAGKEYYVELWVCDAVRGIQSTNNIGVLFSDSSINTGSRVALYITPHINESKVVESTAWYKISGFYTPEKDCRYIIIGNFYPDVQTTNKKIGGSISGGYYYLDDVLVRLKQPGDVATTGKPDEVIIPVEPPPKEEDKPDITTSEKPLEDIAYNVGETIKLDNIFFETDKAVLLPESITELDQLVETMKRHSTLVIEIQGHTDNVGTDEYNQVLSLNRAKAVVDFLTGKGIVSSRISSSGYGSTRPIAGNSTEEGRAMNRRVEFKVVSK